jgi:hypothetical protein
MSAQSGTGPGSRSHWRVVLACLLSVWPWPCRCRIARQHGWRWLSAPPFLWRASDGGLRWQIVRADNRGARIRRSHRTRPTHSSHSGRLLVSLAPPSPPPHGPCPPAAQSLPDQSFVRWCTGVGNLGSHPLGIRARCPIRPSSAATP